MESSKEIDLSDIQSYRRVILVIYFPHPNIIAELEAGLVNKKEARPIQWRFGSKDDFHAVNGEKLKYIILGEL